ncbi:MAG: DUF4097 family beta strand repeat protein [Candidatus Solibacter usitatus]|nr:DUF4097 family beta strand repeat protein [Candidatus Solibacter usitatus]
MRPRSITGPVILIAIGCFFLFRNVWPDIRVYEFFSMYWPFLLIGWGVVRLIEILVWYATGKPLPGRGVSGGEWSLVVLLCVFGTFFFWGSKWSPSWPSRQIRVGGLEIFGEPFEFPMSAEKPAGKTPRVVVEMGRGNAKIIGGDTESVRVSGRKTIRSFDKRGAEQSNVDTPLEIVAVGEQLIIRTNQDKLSDTQRASVELEITVPKGAKLESRGRYGDFDIRDLLGDVEINSDNAGVRVQNIGGNLRVDLKKSDIIRAIGVKGAVELRGRGHDVELESIDGTVTVTGGYTGEILFRNIAKPLRFEGERTQFRVEKASGFARMASGNLTLDNVQGPIQVTAKSRDVQVRSFSGSLDMKVDRGDVEIRPSSLNPGRIDAQISNGDVDLVLPQGAKYDIDAVTARGDLRNDFGVPLRQDREGKGGSVRGTTGVGPQIRVKTGRGAVSVRRVGSESPANILPKTLPKAPEVPARVEQ